jgi:hypothetical protein
MLAVSSRRRRTLARVAVGSVRGNGPADGDVHLCGLRRPASDEDVIPKWVRRTLNPATGVISRAEATGAVSRLQNLTVTLEDMVCQQCNNTWMSMLENRGVKPFLAPMLTNEHAVTLDDNSVTSPAGQSSRCCSWSTPCGGVRHCATSLDAIERRLEADEHSCRFRE